MLKLGQSAVPAENMTTIELVNQRTCVGCLVDQTLRNHPTTLLLEAKDRGSRDYITDIYIVNTDINNSKSLTGRHHIDIPLKQFLLIQFFPDN